MGWFEGWVEQYLGACITFAEDRSLEEMLAAFDLEPDPEPSLETFAEATADPAEDRVRFGQHQGWAYAVEQFSQRGSQHQTLGRLSSPSGRAWSLTFTPTINAWEYFENGAFTFGFDLTLPHVRWGADQQRFDDILPAVLEAPTPGARGGRIVQMAFGIELSAELLATARLPSFALSS